MLDIVQKWKDKISTLIETKVRLMQLDFIERSSNFMSRLIIFLIFIFIGFGFFLFFGFGVAEFFSYLFDSRIGGYFSASVMFFILGLILFVLRKKIHSFFSNKFIQILTEKKADDDEPQSKNS